MEKQRKYYWVITYKSSGKEKTVIIGNEAQQKPKLFPSPTAAARYLEKSGLAATMPKIKCVLCEVDA